jgi:asparagine synthase (glutamine-hydrolysing)
MCGIAGAFAFAAGSAPVDRATLARVGDAMHRRGPDGQGLWISDSTRVGFAHRRLAIIDLSDRALQPMHSRDGRYTIVFNGEIYNYAALKRELEVQGHTFSTTSDTEVLLTLFASEGVAMLTRLRGMFAFAIWDHLARVLTLARDPFGIKPLHYRSERGVFWFASQVRALLESASHRTLEPAGQAGYLLWGSVPEPWTMFRDLFALPPGHYLRVSEEGADVATPFRTVNSILRDAERERTTANAAAALDEVVAAVHDSVRAHHVADVPVGVFLSAGLDSAMLMSSSAELRAETPNADAPHALTLGFDVYAGTASDESALAREIGHITKANHHLQTVSQSDFATQRDSFFAAMDQPTIDGINTWFVSNVAKNNSVKVALSGLGGDEIFASYPSFGEIPRVAQRLRAFHNQGVIGTSIRKASAPLIKKWTSPKYASLFEYGGSFEGAYMLRRALHMPWEIAAILGDEVASDGLQRLDSLAKLQSSFAGIESPRLRVSALEMQWYMRNQLLRDADWAGMAQSIEIRVPFVDTVFVRRAASVFASHPQITKAQVAQAVASRLPSSVLNRPKTGFTVPVREWLGANLSKDTPTTAPPRGLRGWALATAREYERSTAPAAPALNAGNAA